VLRVGLTGGIGSGKSEVSRRLAAHGAVIIDADVAAREVVAPGTPGLAQIAEAFGPGVLDEDLPKIFLPFYTTKSEGTGLGLAVVQKVALQHGGSIEARNRPGGGAEFLLWLPLRQGRSGSLFPSQATDI